MPTPEELAEQIADRIGDPSSVTVGNQTVAMPSAADDIARANFVNSRAAASQNRFGLRFAQIIPPGTG